MPALTIILWHINVTVSPAPIHRVFRRRRRSNPARRQARTPLLSPTHVHLASKLKLANRLRSIDLTGTTHVRTQRQNILNCQTLLSSLVLSIGLNFTVVLQDRYVHIYIYYQNIAKPTWATDLARTPNPIRIWILLIHASVWHTTSCRRRSDYS